MNIYNRLIYTGKCKPRLVCNRYMVLFINYIIPTSLTLKCLLLFALRPKLRGTNRKRASRETTLTLSNQHVSLCDTPDSSFHGL